MKAATPGPWSWEGIRPDRDDPQWFTQELVREDEVVLHHDAPYEVKDADAKLIAAAPDHALLLAAFARGAVRWEPFFPTQDGTKGELAINGMRYVTSLDEFGCPALNEVLRAALTGRRPNP